jgi:hypothetical protein
VTFSVHRTKARDRVAREATAIGLGVGFSEQIGQSIGHALLPLRHHPLPLHRWQEARTFRGRANHAAARTGTALIGVKPTISNPSRIRSRVSTRSSELAV